MNKTVLNPYMGDEEINNFVKKFKNAEVTIQDFDTRRVETKLSVFKAFRYRSNVSGINFYSYIRPEHQGQSLYKANCIAIEESYNLVLDAFIKCRAYLNKIRKLMKSKCVDTARTDNNVSELPNDMHCFGELLLALASRQTLTLSLTPQEQQKKVDFAKQKIKKYLAFLKTVNNGKKVLVYEGEPVNTDSLIDDTEKFYENLTTYSKYLKVLVEFLDMNGLHSLDDLKRFEKECFDVSSYICDVTDKDGRIYAKSTIYDDEIPLDCHVIWGYDNILFPQRNKDFTSVRPHNRSIKYCDKDGKEYVKGSLTQKALACVEELPFI